MARRKAIVLARLNLEQFIQWIAIRQPCGAFLVGGKQIAPRVEGQRAGESDAGANGFAFREVGAEMLNGSMISMTS